MPISVLICRMLGVHCYFYLRCWSDVKERCPPFSNVQPRIFPSCADPHAPARAALPAAKAIALPAAATAFFFFGAPGSGSIAANLVTASSRWPILRQGKRLEAEIGRLWRGLLQNRASIKHTLIGMQRDQRPIACGMDSVFTPARFKASLERDNFLVRALAPSAQRANRTRFPGRSLDKRKSVV